MHRWGRSVVTGFATAVCGAVFALMPFTADLEESIGLWWLFKVRGAIQPPADVVVVAIDGTTGADLDLPRLPRDWPRTMHAQLTNSLVAEGASVIVFDMDFSRVKSAYEDAVFAQAINDAGRVVLFEPLMGKKQAIETSDGSVGGWTWVEKKLSPSPQLASAAKALAPFPLPKLGRTAFEFWAFKSSTGDAPTTAAVALQLHAMAYYEKWLAVLRRAGVPHLDELPSSASDLKEAADTGRVMMTFRKALSADPALRDRLEHAMQYVGELGETERRVLRALAALYAGPANRYLNFYGPPGTIDRVQYQDLIKPDQLETASESGFDLNGKVVFVGYSDLAEPEQPDRFYTVFTDEDGVDLSGVEIMATAFANLLTDDSLRLSSSATTIAIAVAYGFAVGAAAYLFPVAIGIAFGLAVSIGYAAAAQWAFGEARMWLPLVTPILVQLPIAVLLGLVGHYLVERRLERQMSRAISYYLPENIVRDLTERNLDPSQADKVVYGACLATDMSGFTAIAEKKSPTDLAIFMNAYFDAIAKALKRHAVDLTNFHADTIMCAWIGTASDERVRRNAALAAIDVIQTIETFSRQDNSLALTARIGLQDGHFYVGHTGGGGHLAYSILGDPANTAARLESLNKELGTHILVAQSMIDGLSSHILSRPLGSFRLVGKSEAIPVAEILALSASATEEQIALCRRFPQALDALRARDWPQAAGLLRAILDEHTLDGPSRFYLARCERFAKDEMPDIDPTIIQLDRK